MFARKADDLAPRLLGAMLVRVLNDGTRLAGMIVETEAYLGPEDLASHARGGLRTARNASMWAGPGTAYVYFTYGMHYCFNIACWKAGHPAAVLVRGVVPIEGIQRIRELRSRASRASRPIGDARLCDGPGKLCQSFGIDRSFDGIDLASDDRLWIEGGGAIRRRRVHRTARIGIGSTGEWAAAPLRFVLGS